MAFTIIRAVRRSLYDLSAVPAAGTIVLGIGGPFDVTEFSEITAYVRFHPGTTVANDPTTAQVQYYANGNDEEDPASLNGASPPGFAFQKLLTFTGFAAGLKNTSGFMKVTALPSNVGSSINIALVVTPALTGTLSLIMSVDLICKNRDPGPDYYEEREPLLSEVED